MMSSKQDTIGTLRGVLVSATLSAVCLNGFAEDWPQWRGPNRDGKSQETGLDKQWPTGGPPVVWKRAGLGGGYATPSVADGRVFGGGYRGDDDVVWALDAETGATIWDRRVCAADRDLSRADGPRSTPTVDGELLYMLGAGGDLTCLRTSNGAVVWQKHLVKDFRGRMMSRWGFSESPLVDGDKLLCSPGARNGTVIALDKNTGKLLWQSERFKDEAAYTSLIKVEIGGVPQYVSLTGDTLAGIVPENGEILWRDRRKGRTAVVATPIYKDNHFFVTSSYGTGCNLFKVTSGRKFDATEVYANKRIKNHHGGAILVGDHVYASSGPVLVCMDFMSGEVAWEQRSVGKGSLVFADGHFYLRSEKGPVGLIEANPERYVERGRFNQTDRSNKPAWPHPVIADGLLYLRDMDVMLCYDLKAK